MSLLIRPRGSSVAVVLSALVAAAVITGPAQAHLLKVGMQLEQDLPAEPTPPIVAEADVPAAAVATAAAVKAPPTVAPAAGQPDPMTPRAAEAASRAARALADENDVEWDGQAANGTDRVSAATPAPKVTATRGLSVTATSQRSSPAAIKCIAGC